MIFGGVQIIVFFVSQQVYHAESVSDNFGLLLQNMLQWIAYTAFSHCIYSKIGLLVVELSIYKDGHEGLLNNLEEGLIIMDENTRELKFVNKAAKQYINRRPHNSTIIDGGLDSTDDSLTIDWSKIMFALVPTTIFSDAFADVAKAVNDVIALQEFVSLESII